MHHSEATSSQTGACKRAVAGWMGPSRCGSIAHRLPRSFITPWTIYPEMKLAASAASSSSCGRRRGHVSNQTAAIAAIAAERFRTCWTTAGSLADRFCSYSAVTTHAAHAAWAVSCARHVPPRSLRRGPALTRPRLAVRIVQHHRIPSAPTQQRQLYTLAGGLRRRSSRTAHSKDFRCTRSSCRYDANAADLLAIQNVCALRSLDRM